MTKGILPPIPLLPVCRDSDETPEALRGSYIAIGNFDGLHLGHQYLIRQMQARALRAGKPAAVMTFEPHPRQFFNPEKPFFRLTSEAVKEIVLTKLGVDGLFVRGFDGILARQNASDFVSMLRRDIGVSGVVVGHDFHFGRNREGTPERLGILCADQGLDCTVVEPFRDGDIVVSSSAIRKALAEGDIGRANTLLGYRWFIRSTVIHGAKRGRELGFPTANLILDKGWDLSHGCYSVRAVLGDGTVHDGVASFGRRPMFDNGAPLFEVHLFDFSGDLYGQEMNVEIIGWIRAEQSFSSLADLVAAIANDAGTARAQLSVASGSSMIA